MFNTGGFGARVFPVRGDPLAITAAMGSRPEPAPSPARACDFCQHHPDGIAAAATRPCDWLDGRHPLECTNCCEYRAHLFASGAGSARDPHACRVPGVDRLWRKYGPADPSDYGGQHCRMCEAKGLKQHCDVETVLGYACSSCRPGECGVVPGQVLESRPAPAKGSSSAPWLRRACDTCPRNRTGPPCSWLADRRGWGRACSRCEAGNLACLDGGNVVFIPPQSARPAPTWATAHKRADGHADVGEATPWRKRCLTCIESGGRPCQINCATPECACTRCEEMGLDCVGEDGTSYDISDLGRVGFGGMTPFVSCGRCQQLGRNCDRQRPCDSCSCRGEGALCDAFVAGSEASLNCINGRVRPSPGPLYYLTLGYGAGGVEEVKDGQKIEHWIGPPVPLYRLGNSANWQTLWSGVVGLRNMVLPGGAPPQGGRGGLLQGLRPSRLPPAHLAQAVTLGWPEACPMNLHPQYREMLEQAQALIRRVGGFGPSVFGGVTPTLPGALALPGVAPNVRSPPWIGESPTAQSFGEARTLGSLSTETSGRSSLGQLMRSSGENHSWRQGPPSYSASASLISSDDTAPEQVEADYRRFLSSMVSRWNNRRASTACEDTTDVDRPTNPNACRELFIGGPPCSRPIVGAHDFCTVCDELHEMPLGVCDQCNEASIRAVMEGVRPDMFTEMRAYLCGDCAVRARQNSQGLHHEKSILADWAGFSGRLDLGGRAAESRPEAQALTGCSCGPRLLTVRRCLHHRMRLFRDAMAQADKVRESVLQRYGKAVCPMCIRDKAPQDANESPAMFEAYYDASCASWACLVCGDWVIH